MTQTQPNDHLNQLVAGAQDILVIIPKTSSFDQKAVAVSLSRSLQDMGKSTRLYSPTEQEAVPGLIGLELALTELGNQNLCISFDYHEQQVEKVSYHIGEDSQKFYLTIKPQKGQPPLDSQAVEFFYTGAQADLIFLIGIHDFDQLDQLYFGYEDVYQSVPIISINNFEPEFGNLKLNYGSSTCLSEGLARALFDLQFPVNSDSATALLAGIEEATNSFQSMSANAHTFAVTARLMESGARRIRRQIESEVKTSPTKQDQAQSLPKMGQPSSMTEGSFSPKQQSIKSTNQTVKKNNQRTAVSQERMDNKQPEKRDGKKDTHSEQRPFSLTSRKNENQPSKHSYHPRMGG